MSVTVELRVGMAGPGVRMKPRDLYTCSEEEAERLVESGKATYTETATARSSGEKATTARKVTKKKGTKR